MAKQKIAFRLSMPGNNAWNGKWSGDGKLYAKIRAYSSERADQIISRCDYGYSFGDGWFASVNVAAVDGAEAKRIEKQSQGFCGYEWMIDSIERYGKITADSPEVSK